MRLRTHLSVVRLRTHLSVVRRRRLRTYLVVGRFAVASLYRSASAAARMTLSLVEALVGMTEPEAEP